MDNKVKNEALKILIKHEIHQPIFSVDDMRTLCEAEGLRVLSYDEGKEIIQELNIEKFLIRDAFSYNYRGTVIIFYNNHLEILKQLFVLAHELGHHRLQHYSITLEGDEYLEDWKDKEANIFAYELVLPGIIVHECQYDNPFLEETFYIRKAYDYYLSQRDVEDFDIDESLERKILIRFKDYINQYKAAKEKEKKEQQEKLRIRIDNEKLQKQILREKLQKKVLVAIICALLTAFAGLMYKTITIKTSIQDTGYKSIEEALKKPIPKQQTQTANKPVASPAVTPEDSTSSETENLETTVYVTQKGTVYHLTNDCQYVRNNNTTHAILLDEAKTKGMNVCKVCAKNATQ